MGEGELRIGCRLVLERGRGRVVVVVVVKGVVETIGSVGPGWIGWRVVRDDLN